MDGHEQEPTVHQGDPLESPGSEPSAIASLQEVGRLAVWRTPAVVKLLAIALLAEIGYATLNISTMPVYLRFERGIPAGGVGLIVGAFLLSEALFKAPMGALADRYGAKRLIVLGPALSILTIALTLIVPYGRGWLEGGSLMGLRVIDGLGAAMLWPAAFALMGETCDERDRHMGMSLINMCYFIGIAVSLPLGGLANDYVGNYLERFGKADDRSAALYLAALFFLASTIFAYFALPSGRTKRERNAKSELAAGFAPFAQFAEAFRCIPNYLLLGMVTFVGVGFPMVVVKLFAEEMFKMSETQFGLLVLPAAGLMAAMSVPVGRFGERIGRHKAVHYGLALIAIGITWISLGAFFPSLRSLVPIVIGSLPIGLGFLMTIPAWYASVSDIRPNNRAANIGAVMMAQGLGAIIGAQLGSQAYEKLQIYGREFGLYSPFLGCAVCVLLGWLLSVALLD